MKSTKILIDPGYSDFTAIKCTVCGECWTLAPGEKYFHECPALMKTNPTAVNDKHTLDLENDHRMMSRILEMYKNISLPDQFGDPFFYAESALERRRVKCLK